MILGDNLTDAVNDLAQYPVDKVYVYEAPELAVYDAERYCRVLTDVMREHKPEIVLAGATTTGRSFMSGVAIKLYTGLTADCTGLEIGEDGLLHQTRPAYGGNIMATILCPYTRPQMATVRHKVFPTSAKRCEGEAEIVNLDAEADALQLAQQVHRVHRDRWREGEPRRRGHHRHRRTRARRPGELRGHPRACRRARRRGRLEPRGG